MKRVVPGIHSAKEGVITRPESVSLVCITELALPPAKKRVPQASGT
jgi:hypothetical protein